MKAYSEGRIELRNLQFLKKMLEKLNQFLSSDQPSEPKSLDVAFNIAVNLEAIRFEFWTERSVSEGGNVVGDSQIKWWNRELTLQCKLKCYLNPWITHWALALEKGIREPHEVKKESFDLGGNRTHDLRIRSTVTLPTELRGRTEKVGDDLGGTNSRLTCLQITVDII